MGIDRWKQEHRNWRPSGIKLVVPETQPDEFAPAAPSLAAGETAPGAKPRAAAKKAAPSSGSTNRASEKVQPKRSKR